MRDDYNFCPLLSIKVPILLAQSSQASSCVMLEGSCYVMRDILSISGRTVKGLQQEAAAVEAGVLPAAVQYCSSSPTQAPQTRRHPGCPAPSGTRGLWWRSETEYYVLHTIHGIPGCSKVRQLWVSHFNYRALFFCLPPPLLAQVRSCQASFIPGYLLYPWGILKICGLPPALWASPLSHG